MARQIETKKRLTLKSLCSPLCREWSLWGAKNRSCVSGGGFDSCGHVVSVVLVAKVEAAWAPCFLIAAGPSCRWLCRGWEEPGAGVVLVRDSRAADDTLSQLSSWS